MIGFCCHRGFHYKIVREETIYRRTGHNVYLRTERECVCGLTTVIVKEDTHEEHYRQDEVLDLELSRRSTTKF